MIKYYIEYEKLVSQGYINVQGFHKDDNMRITIFKKDNHIIEIKWRYDKILNIKEGYIK